MTCGEGGRPQLGPNQPRKARFRVSVCFRSFCNDIKTKTKTKNNTKTKTKTKTKAKAKIKAKTKTRTTTKT